MEATGTIDLTIEQLPSSGNLDSKMELTNMLSSNGHDNNNQSLVGNLPDNQEEDHPKDEQEGLQGPLPQRNETVNSTQASGAWAMNAQDPPTENSGGVERHAEAQTERR